MSDNKVPHRTPRGNYTAAPISCLEESRPHRRHHFLSVNVKVFGCRPVTDVGLALAAGVRKPPTDETAVGDGLFGRGLWGIERHRWGRGVGRERWTEGTVGVNASD